MKPTDELRPPCLPLAFLRWFCHPGFLEEIEGDLLEQFQLNVAQLGQTKARRLFTADILRLWRPEIIFNHSTFTAMKTSAWLRLLAMNLLFALFVVLPFMPGPSNKLSIGLSALGQMAGFFGVLTLPLGLVWAFFEFRKFRGATGLKVNHWNNGFLLKLPSTSVMGVNHFDYQKTPDAFYLYFKQVHGATIEVVEYDKTQRHNRKGHYFSGETGVANWRYYWLD